MKLVKPFACIIAAAALVAPNAHAGVIAEYTFAGGSAASSDVDGTTTATDVTFGSWLSEDGDGNSPGISAGSETAFGRTEDTGGSSPQNTLADAIASEDYFSFTITGAGFDVKQINYDYFVTAAAAGVVFESHVLTSVTGFTAADVINTQTIPESDSSVYNVAIDTSAIAALQGINNVEVRIYVSDNSTSQQRIHRLQNIVVDNAAVPEPGSLALLGLGGLLIARRRRD